MARAASCTTDFGAYLHISKDQQFVLDLSQSTMLEVIEEYIKLRQKLSPRFGKRLSCLIRHLKIIEQQYACTLIPVQIDRKSTRPELQSLTNLVCRLLLGRAHV